jgi:hypothetical protein
MRNWILILSFSLNDVFNIIRGYWKELDINILGEFIGKIGALIMVFFFLAIYKRIKGESLSDTVNNFVSKKKNEKNT